MSEEQQRQQRIYAGIEYDSNGEPFPIATGRYCEWAHKSIDRALESETFENYKATLRLECDEGQATFFNWTVPIDAPDTLYYQVRILT